MVEQLPRVEAERKTIEDSPTKEDTIEPNQFKQWQKYLSVIFVTKYTA